MIPVLQTLRLGWGGEVGRKLVNWKIWKIRSPGVSARKEINGPLDGSVG